MTAMHRVVRYVPGPAGKSETVITDPSLPTPRPNRAQRRAEERAAKLHRRKVANEIARKVAKNVDPKELVGRLQESEGARVMFARVICYLLRETGRERIPLAELERIGQENMNVSMRPVFDEDPPKGPPRWLVVECAKQAPQPDVALAQAVPKDAPVPGKVSL